MSIVVQKYGGTSVATKENLEKICERIITYAKKNIKLVIVVSAQGNTTDNLIAKANSYSAKPNKKDLDMLLTIGEIESAALLSMMLNDKGYNAVSMTGYQAGILSDSSYGNANIEHIYTENILKYLDDNYIVVVAGFQAFDKLGNITTLGRGGSDLSAVAIASSLKANKCEIYSDIDGIFSADPKIVPKAKLLKKISYDEMLEAASAGAKVLHNRSVSVGKKYDTPIYVKNATKISNGSLVTGGDNNTEIIEDNNIKFITKKEDIAKICIVGNMIMSNKKAITKIFNLADKENITIYMISFSELALNIIVDKDKAENFMKKLHSILIEEK